MKSAGTIASAEQLSESQRSALLCLLADDDPVVYQTIRDKILSLGPPAAEWLRPHLASSDSALRRRAHNIVVHFDRQAADNEFLGFCLRHGEELDLEQGAWLLARTQYPEINITAYQALLDAYAGELRAQLDPGMKARQILTTINQYLFHELGFAGNEANYYEPDNNYLNRVIDRRTGNPINLCLIYLLLARRLRLPVSGISLPSHFICRYQSTEAEVYLDVFAGGKLLTKADCIQFLLQGKHGLQDDYLTPASPRRVLLRICANLHQIFVQLEAAQEVTRLQRYLIVLAR